MAEEIACNGYEYRRQGGEIHRKPIEAKGLNAWEASWLVLNHGEDIPEPVRSHFDQAQNKNAVD